MHWSLFLRLGWLKEIKATIYTLATHQCENIWDHFWNPRHIKNANMIQTEGTLAGWNWRKIRWTNTKNLCLQAPPPFRKKRKKKLNFVWWLSTLFVCNEINFDRFPSGDISFFLLCCPCSPLCYSSKESAPSILNLDTKNATFGTVKILGMKITEQISFTRNGPSNKKLCIKIFLHLYWYPWPQMKPNWLY